MRQRRNARRTRAGIAIVGLLLTALITPAVAVGVDEPVEPAASGDRLAVVSVQRVFRGIPPNNPGSYIDGVSSNGLHVTSCLAGSDRLIADLDTGQERKDQSICPGFTRFKLEQITDSGRYALQARHFKRIDFCCDRLDRDTDNDGVFDEDGATELRSYDVGNNTFSRALSPDGRYALARLGCGVFNPCTEVEAPCDSGSESETGCIVLIDFEAQPAPSVTYLLREDGNSFSAFSRSIERSVACSSSFEGQVEVRRLSIDLEQKTATEGPVSSSVSDSICDVLRVDDDGTAAVMLGNETERRIEILPFDGLPAARTIPLPTGLYAQAVSRYWSRIVATPNWATYGDDEIHLLDGSGVPVLTVATGEFVAADDDVSRVFYRTTEAAGAGDADEVGDAYVARIDSIGDVRVGAVSVEPTTDEIEPGLSEVSIESLPPNRLQELEFSAPSGRRAGGGGSTSPSGRRATGAEQEASLGTSLPIVQRLTLAELGRRRWSVEAGGYGEYLSDIEVRSPVGGWTELLRGTPLESFSGVTFRDLLVMLNEGGLDPNLPLLKVELADIELPESLRSLHPSTWLVGDTPVADLRWTGGQSWCAAMQEVIGLACDEGATLASLDTFGFNDPGSATFEDIARLADLPLLPNADPLRAQGAPVLDVPFTDLTLAVSKLGRAGLQPMLPLEPVVPSSGRLRETPMDRLVTDAFGANATALFNCDPSTCLSGIDSLGEAFDAGRVASDAALEDLGQAAVGVTIGDVIDYLPESATLNDVVVAAVDSADWPWERLDTTTAPLQEFSTNPQSLGFTIHFDLAGNDRIADATVATSLPPGFQYIPGSSTLDGEPIDDALAATGRGSDRAVNGTGLRWFLPRAADGSRSLSFRAWSGTRLGDQSVPASVSIVDLRADADPTTIRVKPPEADPPDVPNGNEPFLSSDSLTVSYITDPDDVDLFKVRRTAANANSVGSLRLATASNLDADLFLYGPPTQAADDPSAAQSRVSGASIPLDDEGRVRVAADREAPPEQADDVTMFTDRPVVGRSLTASAGIEGAQSKDVDLVQVEAYNGATSPDPYVLRVRFDRPDPPPVCARSTATGGRVGPRRRLSTLPSNLNTLVLVNSKRLGDRFGRSAAQRVVDKATSLARAPGVRGAVISVDAIPEIAAAYRAWDAQPCGTDGPNDVVNGITKLIQDVRKGSRARGTTPHRDLQYLVIVGDDGIMPMARIPDTTRLGNERAFASTLPDDSPIGAAFRSGHLLSDDPYGDFDPINWLDHRLYVPELSVGRLVETPSAMIRSIDRYIASGGTLDPSSLYGAGTDFMTDGAEAVWNQARAALTVANGGREPVHTRNIGDEYSGAQLLAALATRPSVAGIYGHADAASIQASARNDIVTAAAVADALGSGARLVFSMGCHTGLNLPPVAGVDQSDFAQELGRKSAIFVATTGYGYGDGNSVAMNEKLFELFGSRLDGSVSIGGALVAAKQEYFAGSGLYGPYDEKVIAATTFYGLPMYRVGRSRATGRTPPPPPVVDGNAATTEARRSTFDIEFDSEDVEGVGQVEVATVDGTTFAPQVTPNRPALPRVEEELPTVRNGTHTKQAHGVLITDLHGTGIERSYDPAVAAASIQTAGEQTENAFGTAALPSRFARINTYSEIRNGRARTRQRLVMTPAHYRTDLEADAGGVGVLRTFDRVSTSVYYSTSADYRAPRVHQVTPTIRSNDVKIDVRVTDAAAIRRVVLLVNSGTDDWATIDLVHGNGDVWSGTVPIPPRRHDLEFIVQAVDANGNVAISNAKGNNYRVSLTAKARADIDWQQAPTPAWAVDQAITVDQSAPDTHWTQTFRWADGSPGGTLELATSQVRRDGTTGDVVRLQIVGASAASDLCTAESNSPGRVVCEVAIRIVEDNPYRFRSWVLDQRDGGQVWVFALIDDVSQSETHIGTVVVDASKTRIGAASTAVHYSGPAAACADVLPSSAVVGPPRINPLDWGYEWTLNPGEILLSGCEGGAIVEQVGSTDNHTVAIRPTAAGGG